MFYIKKRFRFEASHRLLNHKGKCNNIHGHNYKVDVYIGSLELDDMGMVIDFGDLSQLKDWINSNWDHSIIINEDDQEIKSLLKNSIFRIYEMKGNPTAENMAKFLFEKFSSLLKDDRLAIAQIEIYENDDSVAGYYDAD